MSEREDRPKSAATVLNYLVAAGNVLFPEQKSRLPFPGMRLFRRTSRDGWI